MANYILLNRQRERTRGRARIESMGNYITARVYATVYSLTFTATKSAYVLSILAKPTYSKAWNYIDDPAPKPPWVAVGPTANPQATNYPAAAQVTPRTPPAGVPSGVTAVLPVSGRAGGQGTLTVSTTPQQLFATRLPVRRITVLADTANAANVWTGYSPVIAADNAFPLVPGAARDFDIDDASQFWFVGENATDLIHFIYEV